MLLEGSPGHNHVRRVLNAMVGLGGGPAANGQANNGHEIESAATATPSTSATPLSAPSRGWHAIASPSPSVGRGCGWCATASPSTSAARGRGRRVTTSRVVTSPDILAPIPRASLQLEVPPPIPNASPLVRGPSTHGRCISLARGPSTYPRCISSAQGPFTHPTFVA